MQLFSKIRRFAPVAIVALALLAASCTPTKKYGCPGVKASASIR